VFSILVSNDDDHRRNHGFVRDPRPAGWRLRPLYDVVPRPGIAHDRILHLEVGLQGKLTILDNALSAYVRFDLERHDAVSLVSSIVARVRHWKSCFEWLGAPGTLIDTLELACRQLEAVAGPGLREELAVSASEPPRPAGPQSGAPMGPQRGLPR